MKTKEQLKNEADRLYQLVLAGQRTAHSGLLTDQYLEWLESLQTKNIAWQFEAAAHTALAMALWPNKDWEERFEWLELANQMSLQAAKYTPKREYVGGRQNEPITYQVFYIKEEDGRLQPEAKSFRYKE